MKGSFADRVRTAARELGADGKEFSLSELGDKAGIQEYRDNKRVRSAVRDLVLGGELARVGKGTYRCSARKRKPQKQEVMWWHLKRGAVTVEHLQEMADVSADYAREWLENLVSAGVARAYPNGRYQLVKDVQEMPVNEAKAARLRELRKRKKEEVLDALAGARAAIDKAEELVGGMRDEEGVDDEDSEKTELA